MKKGRPKKIRDDDVSTIPAAVPTPLSADKLTTTNNQTDLRADKEKSNKTASVSVLQKRKRITQSSNESDNQSTPTEAIASGSSNKSKKKTNDNAESSIVIEKCNSTGLFKVTVDWTQLMDTDAKLKSAVSIANHMKNVISASAVVRILETIDHNKKIKYASQNLPPEMDAMMQPALKVFLKTDPKRAENIAQHLNNQYTVQQINDYLHIHGLVALLMVKKIHTKQAVVPVRTMSQTVVPEQQTAVPIQITTVSELHLLQQQSAAQTLAVEQQQYIAENGLWTLEMDDTLHYAIMKWVKDGWGKISEMMNEPLENCKKRYFDCIKTGGKWEHDEIRSVVNKCRFYDYDRFTKVENEHLRNALLTYGYSSNCWLKVSQEMGKSVSHCKYQFNKNIATGGIWGKDEVMNTSLLEEVEEISDTIDTVQEEFSVDNVPLTEETTTATTAPIIETIPGIHTTPTATAVVIASKGEATTVTTTVAAEAPSQAELRTVPSTKAAVRTTTTTTTITTTSNIDDTYAHCAENEIRGVLSVSVGGRQNGRKSERNVHSDLESLPGDEDQTYDLDLDVYPGVENQTYDLYLDMNQSKQNQTCDSDLESLHSVENQTYDNGLEVYPSEENQISDLVGLDVYPSEENQTCDSDLESLPSEENQTYDLEMDLYPSEENQTYDPNLDMNPSKENQTSDSDLESLCSEVNQPTTTTTISAIDDNVHYVDDENSMHSVPAAVGVDKDDDSDLESLASEENQTADHDLDPDMYPGDENQTNDHDLDPDMYPGDENQTNDLDPDMYPGEENQTSDRKTEVPVSVASLNNASRHTIDLTEDADDDTAHMTTYRPKHIIQMAEVVHTNKTTTIKSRETTIKPAVVSSSSSSSSHSGIPNKSAMVEKISANVFTDLENEQLRSLLLVHGSTTTGWTKVSEEMGKHVTPCLMQFIENKRRGGIWEHDEEMQQMNLFQSSLVSNPHR